mgnify:CR=1 FL=1
MSTGIQELLEAGVHFGHQTRRWNPKMKPYIFRAHNGVHIIDLAQTAEQLNAACNFIGNTIRGGGKILFVGTKKQAQPLIRELAETHKQHFVTDRWLGGMLTNLKTVKQRLKRLKEIEAMEEDGSIAGYVKQEQASIRREKARLLKNLGGIRHMDSTPDAMFVIDIKREHNAIAEARKLRIPIVALVDTNCDPELVDYPIAGNDDAIKSVQIIVETIGQAVGEARGEHAAAAEQIAETPPVPETTEEAGSTPAEEAGSTPAEEVESTPAEAPVEKTDNTPSSSAESIAEKLHEACNRLGTDEKQISDSISQINSQEEWQAVKTCFQTKYADFHDGDLLKCLKDELSENELKEHVQTPLQGKGIEI